MCRGSCVHFPQHSACTCTKTSAGRAEPKRRSVRSQSPFQVLSPAPPSSADDGAFWPEETVGCVWWWRESERTERGRSEWIDIRGIYISTGVVRPKHYAVRVSREPIPLNVFQVHGGARVMPMCHHRGRIELASSLYLPRRETNTRSRCLAGAEYY